tara:strand:+ start:2690 stop:3031 length:342 start_codon:yes stop_codon:yes gene_type:complete
MKLYKRITYYFFGVLIGSMIVYFITSQKKTTFNYFPQERVIGDLKKKELVFDSSFNQNLKNNFFGNELEIIFSKSIIGKDSCNTYHIEIENSGYFSAKNCMNKVYLTGFSSAK